ncbi:MAG: prepilin-type N-terminal cleavage/methylation domain-containing protein [Verrucomicrobia bacterium]|nr:prepilin-type N-terminal cleavage/methylation domain-containing protein [Verrucomicrobiota bacterium]
MRHRGFTLIEVLVSLAIFALAAVSLGAAYSNVILGRIALQQDEQRLDDIARCRAALMETPGFDDVESGGDIHLPGGRTAHWKGKIEATAVSDLFAVQLTAEIEPTNGGEAEEVTETRMLLRPTWSIPSDRQKIRDEARQRLEKERGYKEADGNSAFISAPTRGKKLVPGQTGANGKGGKGQPATPTNGKNGQPTKGGQPGGQPAARPAKR